MIKINILSFQSVEHFDLRVEHVGILAFALLKIVHANSFIVVYARYVSGLIWKKLNTYSTAAVATINE